MTTTIVFTTNAQIIGSATALAFEPCKNRFISCLQEKEATGKRLKHLRICGKIENGVLQKNGLGENNTYTRCFASPLDSICSVIVETFPDFVQNRLAKPFFID